MRVLIDGPGFQGSVVQLEPLARRSPFPSLGGLSEAHVGRGSRRRSRGVLAGRTGPSNMLAPTAEIRRELSTAADDCVAASNAGVLRVGPDAPLLACERARASRPRRLDSLMYMEVTFSSE